MKKILSILAIVIIIAVVFVLYLLPPIAENLTNPVLNHGPYSASKEAVELHKILKIADLHSDSTLLARDLLKRGNKGHVDIPRLIEGNVALQAFTVVTKAPMGFNINSTKNGRDLITLVEILRHRPVSTWFSLKARALEQARRLQKTADDSNGKFTLIKSSKDLENYLAKRETDQKITAGFLGLEGGHALEGDVKSVDELYDAGFRMIGLTHFFDNDLSGSAQGLKKSGLTPLGKQVLKKMREKHIVIDLAHVSAASMDQILAEFPGPVLVSHTGVKGTCDNNRNLSDDQLRKIASQGGVIGIGYWKEAVCGEGVDYIIKAIKYTVGVVGVDRVALGSDFDGQTKPPFDTTGLVMITDGLLKEGFSKSDIAKIMGWNTLNLLSNCLPQE